MKPTPYPKLLEVIPQANYQLLLSYNTGEKLLFDALPFLNKGIYKPLLNLDLFKTVFVSCNTIEWANGADFDPESLYNLAK